MCLHRFDFSCLDELREVAQRLAPQPLHPGFGSLQGPHREGFSEPMQMRDWLKSQYRRRIPTIRKPATADFET